VTCSPHCHHLTLDHVRRLTNTEQQRVVAGVTTLNNKIFPNISINGLKLPSDIAAGSRCLYVSDLLSVAIWRVKAADSKVDQWLSGVLAVSVSVTSEEKLVMLVVVDVQSSVAERNGTWRGEIQIYSRGAVKETVIKLSPDITAPHCVVMLNQNDAISDSSLISSTLCRPLYTHSHTQKLSHGRFA